MYNNFNSLFDDFFDAFNSVSVKIPPVDVYEMDDGYYLDVELPGYNNDDVNVKIENNTLTLSTTDEFNKSLEKLNEETNFLVRETKMKRSFKRAFSLPKDVDEEAISATFNNGVLNIKLPKSKKLAPKTIEIIAQ
jgi:HSP20 family protein